MVVGGKSEEKKQLLRPRRRWKGMDVKDVARDGIGGLL
jgi:hypothetical protein